MRPQLRLSALVTLVASCVWSLAGGPTLAQTPTPTPARLPDPERLHTTRPDYPVAYGRASAEEIKGVLERVHAYLDKVTPPRLVNRVTGAVQTDYSKISDDDVIERGAFSLTGYEWERG